MRTFLYHVSQMDLSSQSVYHQMNYHFPTTSFLDVLMRTFTIAYSSVSGVFVDRINEFRKSSISSISRWWSRCFHDGDELTAMRWWSHCFHNGDELTAGRWWLMNPNKRITNVCWGIIDNFDVYNAKVPEPLLTEYISDLWWGMGKVDCYCVICRYLGMGNVHKCKWWENSKDSRSTSSAVKMIKIRLLSVRKS